MVTRTWPLDDEHLARVDAPRDDLVLEARSDASEHDPGHSTDDHVYLQEHGPFGSYRRVVEVGVDTITETTT